MKKYVVVAWSNYYPDSFLNNIRAAFDSEAEANKWIQDYYIKYNNYVDDWDNEYVEKYDHIKVLNIEDYLNFRFGE